MAPEALSALALDYTRAMTAIRGRRMQRLVRREFAGADEVLLVRIDGVAARAVLGLSESGAALCASDGRGPWAAVFKWRHGDTEALEAHFDLLKDSLPTLGAHALPLADLRRRVGRLLVPDGVPARAQGWLRAVLAVLG